MINEKQKRVFYCMAYAILVCTGCGRSQEAAVSGVVALDGKPLPRGTVAFQPVAGEPLAYAGIHSDGSYKKFHMRKTPWLEKRTPSSFSRTIV